MPAREQHEGRIRTPDQRLRIFISSTLGELADERQAVRAAVEQLRLAPIMFELGARPHPPRSLYRSYLEQSDVFVGIYWQRYGWVAPDMTISGLEDEYVLSEGMPRLVYVKRPAPDMEPRLRDLLEQLQLEDTTSYKPFETSDELQRLVLDDLSLLLTERFDAFAPAQRRATPTSNLPTPTSELVGRESLLAQLSDLLGRAETRLVTLVGPGGTGKTRLAVQVATHETDSFADGAYFVDLSALRDPDDVVPTIASTLDVKALAGTTIQDALTDRLRDARTLLLLDNFEHLVEAAAGLVELLERCPMVRMLVTSQRALRVRGEQLVPVPPLSLPTSVASSASDALEFEAVRLFARRAAATDPSFEVTDGNAADVVAICTRLDGLPLAIELAAARVNLFGLDELRDRLAERVDVLQAGTRDLPERQRTMQNTIEWSFDLLAAGERDVLALLSLFSGARLTDLERVGNDIPGIGDTAVLEALGSLVDKSFVQSATGADGRPRFTMLQTIQLHATSQLDAQPELAAAARRAHADHYTARAARLAAELSSRDRVEVLAEFSDDLGNMRSAWMLWVDELDIENLNTMLEPLWGYYDLRGDYRSAVELGNDLLRVLAQQPPTAERARDQVAIEMSLARSRLAIQGYTDDAETAFSALLERLGPTGDAGERFATLRCLAALHMLRSDFASAAAVAHELLAIAEREDDAYLLSEAHLVDGVCKMWLIDFDSSIQDVRRSVEYLATADAAFVKFRVGPNAAVVSRAVGALLSWMTGFPDRAVAEMDDAIETAKQLDHPYSYAYVLHHANLLDLWRLDMGRIAIRAEELGRLADAHEYPVWKALSLVFVGVSTVAGGDSDHGLTVLDEGFTLYEGLATPPVFLPALLMMRAMTYAMAGRPDEALRHLAEAEAITRDDDPLLADISMAHGDLLLARGGSDADDAEGWFGRAAELAKARGARMVQLQARTRIAALRRGRPQEKNALDDLRLLAESFTEGFATPQLTAARSLLDQQ
jgi:predicted ATPase